MPVSLFGVFLLFGSFTAISGIGKVRRIGAGTWTKREELEIYRLLDYFRPEVFLGLALTCFFLWLILLSWKRNRLGWAKVATVLSFTGLSLLEICGASYCVATGDYGFDFWLIVFGLRNFQDLAPVLASEANPFLFYGALFFVAICSLLFLVPAKEPPECWIRKKNFFLVAAIVFLGISFAPSPYTQDVLYSQSMTRNVLVSIFNQEEQNLLSTLDLANFQRTFPTEAKLRAKPEMTSKKNLILVILESVRADATTPYQPELDTFPRMHELFQGATRYQNTFTVVPHTTKAISGILCGIEPYISLYFTETDPFYGIPARCLPHLLKEEGYQSGFFQAARASFEAREPLVQNMGFDHFIGRDDLDAERYPHINYFGPEDDALLPKTREWLESVPPETPVMLSILTLITHHKYHLPANFPTKTYVPNPKTSHEKEYDDYLNGVRYTDRFLDKLFSQLKELGRYQDSLIVVIGDHGEGFGEHGRFQHNTTIWNEGIRIPFWIFDPQNPEGRVHEAPVSSLDLLPTVVDALDFELEGEGYPGFVAERRPSDAPVFSHCFRNHSCASVVEGTKKLIYHYGEYPDELYDLSQDPKESRNLAEKEPQLAAELREKIFRWKAENNLSYNAFNNQRAKERRQKEAQASGNSRPE